MNLYRISYVYRKAPDANPLEQTAMIVAETQEIAAGHINAKQGCEVMAVRLHTPNVELATIPRPNSLDVPEFIHFRAGPTPKSEIKKRGKL